MKVGEKLLWLGGALLIAMYFIGLGWADSARDDAIDAFNAQKQQQAISQSLLRWGATMPQLAAASASEVEPSLAANRVVMSVPMPASDGSTIAMLRIPRIALEVPVGYGTDKDVMFRGAGLIEGTAFPGGVGNVAIAAHRDSFFRGLKDVVIGDVIELETLSGSDYYRVSTLSVVEPTDVQVLAQTRESALTLVTCFPFYFVGHAPQRFIVRAIATEFPSQLTRR